MCNIVRFLLESQGGSLCNIDRFVLRVSGKPLRNINGLFLGSQGGSLCNIDDSPRVSPEIISLMSVMRLPRPYPGC